MTVDEVVDMDDVCLCTSDLEGLFCLFVAVYAVTGKDEYFYQRCEKEKLLIIETVISTVQIFEICLGHLFAARSANTNGFFLCYCSNLSEGLSLET